MRWTHGSLLVPDTGEPSSLAVEAHGQLGAVSVHGQDERGRADSLDGDVLEGLPLERGQGLRHLAGRLPSLLPAWKLPVDAERRLLAARAVERAHPTGLEAELEELLERLRVVCADLAFTDRGDERREAAASFVVVH